ncbi:hypothetical protein [Saccharopolyspora gloriosae]|uniref:hypothetical protein n=1 Tax=Saccharopolyspora gloriosae TaxID=455344 RepID=UPI001FB754C9|nr:hypothetical protein [Saccharopolyspora gloriosae]
MSTHVTLSSIRWVDRGFAEMGCTVSVGDDSFTMPVPYQLIDGPVGVHPELYVNEGARSVAWRMDRWAVRNTELQRALPLSLMSMATAVRVAREFAADSGISWQSDEFELSAWSSAWVERNGTVSGGES